jgi:2,4-dienoyl-CoA reductase-like NADH-dependent reductase (Old Yellow Enzyme family)/thioredoxin reductase
MSTLNNLFEPIRVGGLELKNRIVMPAMGTNFASPGGDVTDRQISYYVERARGGVGLIIIEITCVDFTGRGVINQLMIEKDERIYGLSKLAKKIKKEGARVAIQLYHAGLRTDAIFTKTQPMGPSKMEVVGDAVASRELSDFEIDGLIKKFCEAARRARDAGFDAIELHCAHGYLLNQFLSPLYNRRSDHYGGNQQKRTELACQIVKGMRETVGKDYPILCKIPGDEGKENGIKLQDAIVIAEMLEKVGVNGIGVSCGLSEMVFSTMPMGTPLGSFVHLAQGIKKAINIPVIAIGRIKDPVLANLILKEGKADLIGMGRALLADPYVPSKALMGKLGEIRPCIGCICCVTQIANMSPVLCTVNPSLGREEEGSVRVGSPKKILVAGGGPGGLVAAISCAKKGHDVVLMEMNKSLGGLMSIASVPPKKEEIDEFNKYVSRELVRVGVTVKMGEEVTSEVVKKFNPEAIIIATGSEPAIPGISGINGKNVVMALDILRNKVKAGRNVVIIGGGQIGLEVADHLSQQGISVTVVEQLPQVGLDVLPRIKIFLMARLLEKKVKIIVQAKAIEINDSGVVVELPGKRETIAGDQIIIATGMKSRNNLVEDLNRDLPDFKNIYIIGDTIKPRGILEAVREGYEVGELL